MNVRRNLAVPARAGLVLTATAIAASSLLIGAQSSQAATTTTIKLKVAGCSGCKVVAHRGASQILGTSTAVRNGRATLRIPTGKTKGVSFEIVAPNTHGSANKVADVALRYPGIKAGTKVPNSHSAKQKKAYIHWAGTRKRSITIRISVVKFRSDGTGGGTRSRFAAHASPALKSTGTADQCTMYSGVGPLPAND